jgi:hypothetical protein
MKGLSSIFIPMKRDRETSTVQWHLISSPNKEKILSYQDAVTRCCDRALLAEVDLQSLLTTRVVVGWYSTVETVLGREDVNYENIECSTAQEVARPLKVQSAALGFQQFGVGQLDLRLGQKTECVIFRVWAICTNHCRV